MHVILHIRRFVCTRLTISAAALAISMMFAPPAEAATFYVATNGNDSNSGSETQPFRTIGLAYSRANAGDTVIVKPGVYTEYKSGYGIHVNRSGTASSPIVLKSEKKGQAILDGENRSDRPEVMYITGSYNIIDGFQMKNGFKGGITLYGSNNQIRNNEICNNGNVGDPSSAYGQDGIYSDKATSGNIYWGNHIHHNGRISLNSNLDHGLYLCGDNELVANNVVTFNSAYGIHIAGYSTVANMKIYNNVFAWNGRSGAIIWQLVSAIDFRNNIFYKNKAYGVDSYEAHGTGVNLDRNTFYGNSSGIKRLTNGGSDFSHTLGTEYAHNPLFVNETLDFRLQSISPDINKGASLAVVDTDSDGSPRPQGDSHDVGAYEYPTGAPTPTPPSNLRLASQ